MSALRRPSFGFFEAPPMSDSDRKASRVCIDGKWVACKSAEDMGFLGNRALCDLGAHTGQTNKRLLLRTLATPTPATPSKDDNGNVTIELLPHANGLDLRSPVAKDYDYATPTDRGKHTATVSRFAQQDITDLISLKQAILAAAVAGPSKRVWRLFYAACKALNEYGTVVAPSVILQCPSSLAVHESTGRVVLLDAELKAPTLPAGAEDYFFKWFATTTRERRVSVAEASRLHSRALLLYFRYILGYLHEQPGFAPDAAPAQALVSQLTAMPRPDSLDDALDWLKNFGEDWSIPADDAAQAAPLATLVQPNAAPQAALVLRARAAPASRRACSTLIMLACSLLSNVILLPMVAILAYLLWTGPAPAVEASPGGAEAGAKIDAQNIPDVVKSYPVDPGLRFASCDVIFPAHGTSRQKVHDAVLSLFPDRIIAPKPGAEERRRLLRTQRDAAGESIKKPAALASLLDRLIGDHAVRFQGFAPEAADRGIGTIIERGGLFTITSPTGKRKHGSLLQGNGVELIAAHTGLDKSGADSVILHELRQAVAEYASFEDALMIVGDRPAVLLRVDPTAQAHEDIRRQLLGRDGTPVFMPRPVLELFDAVDPADDTGGGIARYMLKLERKCNWRLVSKASRADADFENTAKERLRWGEFDAGELISWRPVSVTRKSGQADAVATFDIAVILSDEKIVVFRNQSIIGGDSRAQVQRQCRTYLERVLCVVYLSQSRPAKSVSKACANTCWISANRFSWLSLTVSA
jgi:hypothetical protein